MKHSFSFRNLFFVVAVISCLLLTACGGGGGGGGGGKGVNDAMVGTWYLNLEDGKPVVPNAKGQVDTLVLKSDGTCSMTVYVLSDKNQTYWEVGASEGTDKGTWSYADGRLYIKIDGEENSFPVSLDNGKLTITSTYEDSKDTWTSVYKKTKYGESQDSGGGSSTAVAPVDSTINQKLVGTWYLNEEDGKPVVPNSKGEAGTMILNSDGSCSMTDYGLTDKNHTSYWETQQSEGAEKGKWKYSNNKLCITIDGVERSFETSISNDTLTIKGKYENSSKTWVSVYKKTKYKLELYSGGSGTESDPYIIAKAKDLDNVRYNLSAHYLQTKDVDLSEFAENYTAEFRGISGKGWVPIGGNNENDESDCFTGTFNGNGHQITNLYINRAAPGQGLISVLGEGGNLKGINIIVHSKGITGTGILGGLVALAASSSEISNCTVKKANITGFQESIGGLVGWSGANISKCSVDCTINVGVLNDDSEGGVGGLVGTSFGSGNITDSKVECAINSEVGNVGGLIGKSNTTGYIKNCTAYGTVLCNESVNAGGLIGNNTSTVEYSIAKVAVMGCYGCGGFVGINSGKISKCYSEGGVGSVSSGNCGFTGGFAGTNSNQITDCYSLTEGVVAKSDSSTKSSGPVSCFVSYNLENGVINRCYATGKASCRSIASGGIVGWNKGEVKNSFALCESVLVINGDVGRVVGYGDGSIKNCYAISTMTVNQSKPSTNIGTNQTNGGTVTASSYQNKSWWTNTLGFSSTYWTFSTTNKRMELKNMPSL